MIASGYQIMVKHKANQRPNLEDIWPEVFPAGAPKQKTLTEISGHSGTGKSLLLYHIMARTLLTNSHGGKSSKLIFIDLNHKLRIGDFKRCLENALLDTVHSTSLSQDDVLRNCLKSVVYLPCYSAEQFDLVLEDMDDLLWDHDNVSLLTIDGLDACYWEDCYGHLMRMSTHYKKLCQRLKPICQEHNICCMYTVDTNYLQPKYKVVSNVCNPMIDYKLKLVMDINGCRYLNDRPINIDEDSGLIKCLE